MVTRPETGGVDQAGPGAPVVQRHDVVTYVAALRQAGLVVSTDSGVLFAEALGVVDRDDVDAVFWASRATLTRSPQDRAVHDAVFARFFLGAPNMLAAGVVIEAETEVAYDSVDEPDDGHDTGADDQRLDDESVVVRFSSAESLRDRDFADCSPEELDELAAAIARLRMNGVRQRSRRRRAGGAEELDLRRTVRDAVRTNGEAVRLHRRRRRTRPRRVVLLVDISGSMEPYARALVRFGHALVQGRPRVEVFSLATRCTRLTRELSSRDPDAALESAAAAVQDWSGGTRLGDDLARFCQEWGQRGAARNADVVILSDGWDRGDPAILAEQMARLSRLAARVIWANPLRATPGYQPLARGMAAALPYCDRFVDGHSLGSLDALVELLEQP